MKSQEPSTFGVLSDGREVMEYTLRNEFGVVVKILDYGGIIRTLEVPDRLGQSADIVLGFDELSEYESEHPYFGGIIGRVAGRIGGGRLPIDGFVHQLSVNDPPNHLHGGQSGFDHRLWNAEFSSSKQTLTLTHESPSGEEGYPGNLLSTVTYRLTSTNDLVVDFTATTDVATVVNMTQHSYFNLSGDPGKKVLDHELTVPSGKVLELNQHAIPTGKETDISGSKLDFRSPSKIETVSGRINDSGEYDGLDHYWILPGANDRSLPRLAVELFHPESGRRLQIATTAPGLQIYSGNQIPSDLTGKRGVLYGPFAGVCFEAQIHPDSPNRPEFPSVLLSANETYKSTTVFRFRIS